ncbi:serine hydrolase [Actinosynnema sp. NPDC023794]
MPLTRRHLFRACGVAGAATLLPAAGANAAPDDWLGWFRANRQHVAVALDDGRGGRIAHRAHERQPLASAVKVVHLAAYAKGVERGLVRPDEKVRVGDWEQYYLGLDGGAHQAALRALDIPFSNGVTADDPRRFVRLDELVGVMIRHSDNAATDFVRYRVGEGLIRATAAQWPKLEVPEILAEWLRFVLGRRVGVQQYLRDPRLRLEVLGKFPDVPKTYEAQRAWARSTWTGTAAAVERAHRESASVPLARGHLESGNPVGPGVVGVGFKGGSLPGIVTVGFSVRWEDGRVGSAAVLTREVDEAWHGRSGELVRLVRTALVEPDVLREFQVSLS